MNTTSNVPTRVAAYIRVSSRSQDYDYQLSEVRRYCAYRGWPEPLPELVYTDKLTARKSPSKDPRPGHARLKEDARRRHMDVIICWRMDRLARSARNMADWSELAQKANLKLVFIAERLSNEDDTPAGKMFFQLVALMAEFTASIIQENREAGIRYAKEQGRTDLGGAPRKRDWNAICEAYEQGKTWNEIAEEFNINRATVGRIVRKRGLSGDRPRSRQRAAKAAAGGVTPSVDEVLLETR